MDVLQKEIDEVYATHPTAHEALDNGIVEQHQQFVRSLTEVNGCWRLLGGRGGQPATWLLPAVSPAFMI